MQLLSTRYIAGPNIYSYRPVIKATLNIGAYEDLASNMIDGFVARLLALLPGLHQHNCSRGYPGGFVERLQEGTYLAHIFEHVALELQSLAGEEYAAGFGKTRGAGSPGVYLVVFGCKAGRVGLMAAEGAYRLLMAALDGKDFNVPEYVARLKRIGEDGRLGPSTAAIYAAAKRRGIPVLRPDYETNFLILGYGKRQQRVWATITGQTSSLAVDFVSDKFLTNKLLRNNAIPVPEGYVAATMPEAVDAFRSIGAPVAVKPLSGNHGKGVTLHITKLAELERAFQLAKEYDERVLVEEYVTGRQYRLCIINGKLAAGAERIAAHVVGDGLHTVAELVEQVNTDPARGGGHSRPLTYLQLDGAAIMTLARQKLTAASVPGIGQKVYIRDNANLSTGATAEDVTDMIHPETVRLVERAVRLTGLDVAGVDLVIPDICQPLVAGRGAIIEINAAPGLRMHLYPSAGKPRDLGMAIVNYLFPGRADGRIPIIAVTGTNGKTTVTRLIAHIFRQAGHKTGMTTSGGIYVDQECIAKGDTTGPASAAMILADPAVEVAVLEVARGGIIRGGLGYDFSDIGIITNITEDHLGQDGIEDLEDLAYIKSLVVERVLPEGAVLLNADDSRVVMLRARSKGEIVYFSTQPDNIIIRRHLGEGGKACFVKKGAIYLADGQKEQKLIKIVNIPLTLRGYALHNIQNTVIAAAACWLQQLPLTTIRQGLMSFSQNPGRLMLMAIENFRVCVDYAHNPAGCQALVNTLRCLKPHRLVGVIAAPGDRRDDVIVSLGRVAGKGFDSIYIKEDHDLRGRQPGETAALLMQGALAGGLSAGQITIVLDEGEAVATALKQAKADDLIAIFFENYDIVMNAITGYTTNNCRGKPDCHELVVAGMRVE
ncbi:cyanophycin synthetase [Sporomusa acidovorans]|uniref:Cyanophycin synthetase n=1 Tax=Sporomusa acidovorans (strain ATCC 49682 / DSM 3132 / Mol) TaxID=1123286 RepID=A0ABZ3IW26_SPOA4|nr:cyanophycin synthetase [Sporomusa acidovorans]OZC14020.1 cyanophycin synthetase [Sporomusa acidovorans DSM 3132]SDF22584.1 cyanophycin synthetase [Sporomusa acidovorans]